MIKRVSPICVAAIAFIWCGVSAEAATLQEMLRITWNEQSMATLKKLVPDRDTALAVVKEVIQLQPASDGDDLDVDGADVADYGFFDLNGDGNVQLVCALDYSGRGIVRGLVVINNRNGHVGIVAAPDDEGNYGMGKLENVIQDIKGDGRKEIILEEALGSMVHRTIPTPYMDHVYVYRSEQFVQSDREFIDYYKTQLDALRQEFETLSHQAPPSDATQEERQEYQQTIAAKQKEIEAVTKMLSEP